MIRNILAAASLSLISLVAFGQDTVLPLSDYLALVKQYHPVAVQAGLNTDKAFYTRRMAIGGFDPKLEFNSDQKVFDGKTYYDYMVPEVKIPLWYGMDLKGSYTTYNGDFVNPENKVPSNGLGFLGLSVPLGRGLFIDERRAALKQAAVFKNIAANDQRQMLNDLFINATQTYAEWLNAWLNRRVYNQAVKLAEVRLDGTRLLYKNGDRPAIDTLEALTLLQSRQQKLIEYETVVLNKKNELSSFLWLEGLTPTDPAKLNIVPDTTLIAMSAPDSLLWKTPASIPDQNPEVIDYRLKIDQLNIERRLKLEDIKPTVNVNFGLLNSGRNVFNNMNLNWLQNNQKLGFTVAMPFTLTKQRAAYSLSKIKIKEAEFELMNKRNLVEVKWSNYRNDFLNLEKQVSIHTDMQKNNKLLLDGEEIRFKMGESSLFLINSREQKLLDTQEKLNEIYTKRIKTIQYLRWLSSSW